MSATIKDVLQFQGVTVDQVGNTLQVAGGCRSDAVFSEEQREMYLLTPLVGSRPLGVRGMPSSLLLGGDNVKPTAR